MKQALIKTRQVRGYLNRRRSSPNYRFEWPFELAELAMSSGNYPRLGLIDLPALTFHPVQLPGEVCAGFVSFLRVILVDKVKTW
jgi:hypothetical protein